MKNIAIVGDYTGSYDIFSRLKEYDKNISILEITPKTNDKLKSSNIVILNKFNNNINLSNISPKSCVIINLDCFTKNAACIIYASQLITTGYSPKSTLTVSSVSISNINSVLCCLQRSFNSHEGNGIQEEFMIRTHLNNISILLTAVAAALYMNIDKDIIQNIFI